MIASSDPYPSVPLSHFHSLDSRHVPLVIHLLDHSATNVADDLAVAHHHMLAAAPDSPTWSG
jgi:hypothetical protein